jgi:succinoglycan biosynthesis protein ExoM
LRGRFRNRGNGDAGGLVVRILSRIDWRIVEDKGEKYGKEIKIGDAGTDKAMNMASPPNRADARPTVSVVMANFNGSAHLAEAIESVQSQTLRNIELLISDDASTDQSVDIVTKKMATDPRIRLVRSERNTGPAAARNRAIDMARGEWIAIMDSDDLMRPGRLESLVDMGERDRVDIVADDLVEFYDNPRQAPRALFGSCDRTEPISVDIIDYVRRNHFYSSAPPLGYLKPIFRGALFAGDDGRYDEKLRISEDFDLVLRFLYAGRSMRIYALPLYLYRKHSNSISHRLSTTALEAIRDGSLRFKERVSVSDSRLAAALKERLDSIDVALAYEYLLLAIKNRNWKSAFHLALNEPRAFYLLRLPVLRRLGMMAPTWLNHRSAGSYLDLSAPSPTTEDIGNSNLSAGSTEGNPSPQFVDKIPETVDIKDLTVCICTFRRRSIIEAIKSVSAQSISNGVSVKIMVIDNDDLPSAKKLIDEHCAAAHMAIKYHHVPGKNISMARNAALERADSRWLAFIDDDEQASVNWLAGLISIGKGANAVFGPCEAIYPNGTPRWIRVGDYHSNRIPEKSLAIITGYTSNVLIDIEFVRRFKLKFDTALGRTGGEDTVFFHAMHSKGGVLRYARDAVVHEYVVPQRIGFRWIATRRYRAGQVYAKLFYDFSRSKYWKVASSAPLKVAVCICASAATAFDPSRAMWWLMRGIFHAGSLSFVLGANVYEEYAATRSRPIHAD